MNVLHARSVEAFRVPCFDKLFAESGQAVGAFHLTEAVTALWDHDVKTVWKRPCHVVAVHGRRDWIPLAGKDQHRHV